MADVRDRHFVGRQQQLVLLRRYYEAAAAGSGAVALVSGESGAGKSRLALEFCSSLPPEQARCVSGQCLEYAQSPLAPFLAALSAIITGDQGVLAQSVGIRSTLAPLLPEVLDPGHVRLDRESDTLRQFNAISETLRLFGASRPTVVVLDDIQWADRATLDLLQHLAAHIDTARVLIIATYRIEELKRSPLRSALAKLGRQRTVQHIEVTPLSDVEMHELVFRILEHRSELPIATIGAICAMAEGNPLFAEELVKTVVESGKAEAGARLPTTLREAVLERVAVLDDRDRALVTHAAVIGRRFQPEFLAAIAGTSFDAAIGALKHAIDLGLIVEAHDGEIHFAFRHELTRRAVYDELLATEVRLLHKKIAAALEESDAEKHVAELAYHWWQAGDREKAARYQERAGDAALAVFAFRDALTSFERAMQFGSGDGAHGAALQLKLASALHQCGLSERAVRATEAALAYYESVDDKGNAASTCLRLAWLRGGYGDSEIALRYTERAIGLIGDDPSSPTYFDAHVQALRLYTEYRWDPRKQAEHTELAERATGSRSAASRVSFQALRSVMLIGQAQLMEALACAREAAALAMQYDDARGAVQSWATFAIEAAQAGEKAFAFEGFERALEILREKGPGGLTDAWVVGSYAHLKLTAGDLAAGRELVQQGLATNIETPTFRMLLARAGILIGVQLEDDELIARCAAQALVDLALRSVDPYTVGITAAFAEAALVGGKGADASALLDQALNALERIEARPRFGDIDALCLAVVRFGAEGDILRARSFLAEAAAAARVRSTAANLVMFDAYAAKRAGDQETAAQRAADAAQLYRDIGWPHFEAQALEVEGKAAEAFEIYGRIGATRDVHRLDAVLNPINRRGRSKGELTAREREICDLLTKGKTNKAIAEELVLSERTVESHVSSVLTKMGAASRAELIAKLKSPG